MQAYRIDQIVMSMPTRVTAILKTFTVMPIHAKALPAVLLLRIFVISCEGNDHPRKGARNAGLALGFTEHTPRCAAALCAGPYYPRTPTRRHIYPVPRIHYAQRLIGRNLNIHRNLIRYFWH